MKTLLVALFLTFSGTSVLALPPAVELDRLMLHAKTALDDKSYDVAVAQYVQAQKLGIALPENFALGYATALAGQGKDAEAQDLLDKYLNKYGMKGASYKPVLALLVRLEAKSDGKGKPSQQATTSSSSPRPGVPFAIDESIWRTLENSEMYRNTPRPRALRTRSVYQDSAVYTGSKSSTLKTPAPAMRTKETEFSPLSDKCQTHKMQTYHAEQGKTFGGYLGYLCGNISLGSTQEGKLASSITNLGPLSGSLYPPRIGSEQRVQYESSFMPDRRFDSRTINHCKITGRMAASQLHARLTGTAWVVQCHNEIVWIGGHDGKPMISDIEDYLLEDMGIMLSSIGVVNMLDKRTAIPTPSYQSVIVAEGDYGSRTTSTYQSHAWAVGEAGASTVDGPAMQ